MAVWLTESCLLFGNTRQRPWAKQKRTDRYLLADGFLVVASWSMASGQLQNRSMMQQRLQDLAYVNELVSSADGAGGGLVQIVIALRT